MSIKMNVLIINGSPKGEYSITLHTSLFLEKKFPECKFEVHRFFELIHDSGVSFKGKYATQISTSKPFYDTTAHEFMRQNLEDLGFNVLEGLSADMEDLPTEKGQSEAYKFFEYVLWQMRGGEHKISDESKRVVVAPYRDII